MPACSRLPRNAGEPSSGVAAGKCSQNGRKREPYSSADGKGRSRRIIAHSRFERRCPDAYPEHVEHDLGDERHNHARKDRAPRYLIDHYGARIFGWGRRTNVRRVTNVWRFWLIYVRHRDLRLTCVFDENGVAGRGRRGEGGGKPDLSSWVRGRVPSYARPRR